jgi:hypothetical protein
VNAVFSWQHPAFWELNRDIALQVLQRAIDTKVEGVITTMVFVPAIISLYEHMRELVISQGGSIFPVELRCELEENLRRVVQPDRAAFGKMLSAETLRDGIERHAFDPPADLPGNIFLNVTHAPAAGTALLIAAHIGFEASG